MVPSWVGRYRERIRGELRAAFGTDHPPKLVAVSFAVGVFVTALPSLGSGVLVLAWLGYRYDWANSLAFVAAVTVLNPIAKSGVYVASVGLGVALLGPVPGIASGEVGLTAGRSVLARLLLGNLLLAVGFAVVGYVLAYRGVRAYRRRGTITFFQ